MDYTGCTWLRSNCLPCDGPIVVLEIFGDSWMWLPCRKSCKGDISQNSNDHMLLMSLVMVFHGY